MFFVSKKKTNHVDNFENAEREREEEHFGFQNGNNVYLVQNFKMLKSQPENNLKLFILSWKF